MQAKFSDPETEHKLHNKVKKLKASLEDAHEELEHVRESRSNSDELCTLRSQVEDLELREIASVKSMKRLQGDMEELQIQHDDVIRSKIALESQLNDLQKERSDLESRLEEQDEVEQLVSKQRYHISQLNTVQQQLNDANYLVEELQESKHSQENKITHLEEKISDLEKGVNKQDLEATETKVRELEQKLELEKSTNRRQELAEAQQQYSELEQSHKIDTVKEEVAMKDATIQRLKEQMELLKKKEEEYQMKIKELQEENIKLKERIEVKLLDQEWTNETSKPADSHSTSGSPFTSFSSTSYYSFVIEPYPTLVARYVITVNSPAQYFDDQNMNSFVEQLQQYI